MALYFVFVTALAMLMALFGFILPALVSAESDAAVLTALVVFVMIPVVAKVFYIVIKKILNKKGVSE